MFRLAVSAFFCIFFSAMASAAYEAEFEAQKSYFREGRAAAGKLNVWLNDRLVALNTLSSDDLMTAQDHLEALMLSDPQSVPGGEVGVRKMLRAVRYWRGPSFNAQAAVQWQVEVVIVPRVDIHWSDTKGRHSYSSSIGNVANWTAAIQREMGYFRDLVYVLSWGKINLSWRTSVSQVVARDVVPSAGVFFLNPKNIAQILASTVPDGKSKSAILWLPNDVTADNQPPNWVGTAYTGADVQTWGSHSVTVVHTTQERMFLDHGWAKKEGGGLVHEFWHVMEQWMKNKVGYKGFVPNNHVAADYNILMDEIASQALPQPYQQYAEYFGSWPTRIMLLK